MGPSRLFHKNKSQHSLLSTQDANEKRSYHASPIDSPLHSPVLAPPGAPSSYNDGEEGGQSYNLPYRPDEPRFYQSGQPTRSQSQRSPKLINTNQPTIHLVGPAASTPASAVDPQDDPDRYYLQEGQNPPAPKEDRKKRRFFGLGSLSKEPSRPASQTSGKLGRSISVRRKDQFSDRPTEAGRHTDQYHWSSSRVSGTEDGGVERDEGEEEEEEEEAGGGSGLHPSHHPQSIHPQEKDPLRSPAFPPPITHQEYAYGRAAAQHNHSPGPSARYPLDRQGSYQSPWERAAHQVQQHAQSEHGQQQTPASYHPSPASASSTSSHPFSHRFPHDAIQQHWQDQNSRPSSQQSVERPSSAHHLRTYDGHHAKSNSNQIPNTSYTQGPMGPPAPQQPPSRRSSEAQQNQQPPLVREGSGYQPYSQNVQGVVVPSNAPPQYNAQLAPQGQNYRGNTQPSPMQQPGNTEQGRSTPPPSRSRDDLSSLDVAQLLARHDELQDKYRKVKKYYFDKDAQVQQLQNTIAHQRLSQSRTSLDDNEYSNRFSRLDGAINNLAFNIRRDWRSVPLWLAPHVNRDATTTATKEMTAVARAAISRWLVEELLERYFHPGIEPGFSTQLKIVEKNLRRFASPTPSDEEKDTLLAKISNWRLSTLDGLSEVLASPQANEYRASLTSSLVEKLTASLSMMLKDPPPPGLEGGVSMIVELAVGIAANLPMESRDVFVQYCSPGQPVNDTYMKIESGLPALTNPGDGPTDGADSASLVSKQTDETGSIEAGNSNENCSEDAAAQQAQQQSQQPQAPGVAKKKGMFGGFMGGAGSTKKGSVSGGQGGQPGQPGQGQQPAKEEKVRFSTFMAVEVRGRSVLMKAPVYVRE